MKKFIPLILSIFLLSACNVSTANLSNAISCVPENFVDSECIAEDTVFSSDVAEIFVSVELDNSPDSTEVTFDWYFIEEGEFIDSVTLKPELNSAVLFTSLEQPTFEGGWPPGLYEVEMSMNWDNFEPISVNFTVE